MLHVYIFCMHVLQYIEFGKNFKALECSASTNMEMNAFSPFDSVCLYN